MVEKLQTHSDKRVHKNQKAAELEGGHESCKNGTKRVYILIGIYIIPIIFPFNHHKSLFFKNTGPY